MANTYSALFYHLVFSTKNRTAFLHPEIETRVWAYLGGIAREQKMTAIQIGGVDDHIHALIMAPPTMAPFEIAKYIKRDSSKWIHETFADLQDFAWQDGYGAFTVSKSSVSAVASYIQNQRTHHQKQGFQDEYRECLNRHGVDYDERYVWG